MRKMLLSFRAEVYEKVITGEKIYEHRKVFPDGPIEAYLYVSNPVKAVVGIMHLDNKISLERWKEKYAYDKKALERIEEYQKYHKYAMEITDFQNTNKISLSKLREEIPGFVVPQMYYFIDDTELLNYLYSNLHPIGKRIVYDFSRVDASQICKQ